MRKLRKNTRVKTSVNSNKRTEEIPAHNSEESYEGSQGNQPGRSPRRSLLNSTTKVNVSGILKKKFKEDESPWKENLSLIVIPKD